MQTILGAGGTIGLDLARILPEYTDRVRLVSRTPEPVLETNEVLAADLLDEIATTNAVAGSDVVYLVAGLPYKADVWERQWPVVMRNAIAACAKHKARLVFLDNIYMYDRDHLGAMDEDTPVRPTSRKGAVRAAIAKQLMSAVAAGRVEALIARAPDFYGPGRQQNSVLAQTVFERVAKGSSGQWLLSADHPHSFIYTPDASRATALLGNADDAYGKVWHLPTTPSPPTGRQWVEMIAAEFGARARVQVASDTMLRLMGLFIPALREVREMAYQYDRDYEFVSDRFITRFGFTPTPYLEGIRATIAADYSRG